MEKGLSEQSVEILCSTLGVASLDELMDRDFQDITPEQDVDRETVARTYGSLIRGSVRLGKGLFYTASEHAERVRLVNAMKLP